MSSGAAPIQLTVRLLSRTSLLTTYISEYFLSHFHADHYGGLGKQWTGSVYCRYVTTSAGRVTVNTLSCQCFHCATCVPAAACAAQVHQATAHERGCHGVSHRNLKNAIVESTMSCAQVAGVEVTLVDANHCPGAVLFLFKLNTGKVILHTGISRVCQLSRFQCLFRRLSCQSATALPASRPSVVPAHRRVVPRHGIVNVINCNSLKQFLLQTYCDEKYAFPDQSEMLALVARIAAEALRFIQCYVLHHTHDIMRYSQNKSTHAVRCRHIHDWQGRAVCVASQRLSWQCRSACLSASPTSSIWTRSTWTAASSRSVMHIVSETGSWSLHSDSQVSGRRLLQVSPDDQPRALATARAATLHAHTPSAVSSCRSIIYHHQSLGAEAC